MAVVISQERLTIHLSRKLNVTCKFSIKPQGLSLGNNHHTPGILTLGIKTDYQQTKKIWTVVCDTEDPQDSVLHLRQMKTLGPQSGLLSSLLPYIKENNLKDQDAQCLIVLSYSIFLIVECLILSPITIFLSKYTIYFLGLPMCWQVLKSLGIYLYAK